MAQQRHHNGPLVLQSQVARIDAGQGLINVIVKMRLDLAKRIEIADEAIRPASDIDLTTEGIGHDQAASTLAVGAEVADAAPVPLVALTTTRSGVPTCPAIGV